MVENFVTHIATLVRRHIILDKCMINIQEEVKKGELRKHRGCKKKEN